MPIKTKWIKDEAERQKMYNFIAKKIKEGRQVYVVSPLIEESETLNVKSAQETFEEYSRIFPDRRIGLIHGKQNYKEKQEVMSKFKKHELDILVSTTVIEVGVNVPNASIMVIRDAQRFGLSSLHQLRGRVGRGQYQSYCFLESETDNELSARRLEVMEKTTDGFKIAEEDLKLRNSGEIMGTRQSGVSDMVLTDIVKNVKEIKYIRDYVVKYLEQNNGKIKNEYLRDDNFCPKAYPLEAKYHAEDYAIWDGGGLDEDLEIEICDLEEEFDDEVSYYQDIGNDHTYLHKFGGYPSYCQPGLGLEAIKGYHFVFQISSDEVARYNIVDSGSLMFFYNENEDKWVIYYDFY